MKKKLLILMYVVLLASSAAAAQKAIKLSGGLSSFIGGDYNRATQGFFDHLRDVYGSAQGEFGRIGSGLDISGEFIMPIRPSLSLGIGLGLNRAETTESQAVFINPADPSQRNSNTPWGAVQAVPLTANIHWTLPILSSLSLNVFGGPGFYFAKFQYKEEYDVAGSENVVGGIEYSGSQIVLGIQGGIALEATIWKTVSLVAEIVGRAGSMSGFRGDWSYHDTFADGTAYSESLANYAVWIGSLAGPTAQHNIFVFDPRQPGSPFTGVSEAHISLTAITARVGLKIGL